MELIEGFNQVLVSSGFIRTYASHNSTKIERQIMSRFRLIRDTMMVGALGVALIFVTGCEQLPGSPEAQGATIGGVGGAAAGAAIGGEDNRLLGALLGGAIGAAGGYVVGANSDKILNKDSHGAEQSVKTAQSRPATAQDAIRAQTADLNGDGFVTMDEVVAMRAAGFTDQQILDRLAATGQVFELTAEQQNYLRQRGISDNVVNQMVNLNRDVRDRLISQRSDVISQPGTRQ